MSKSLGNSVYAAECWPSAARSSCATPSRRAHYRSTHRLPRRRARRGRGGARPHRGLPRARRRALARHGVSTGVARGRCPTRSPTAMDDDLGVPQALAVLHDTVRAGNAALDADDLRRRRRAFARGRRDDRACSASTRSTRSGRAAAPRPRRPRSTPSSRRLHRRARRRARREGLRGGRPHPRRIAAAGIALEDTADRNALESRMRPKPGEPARRRARRQQGQEGPHEGHRRARRKAARGQGADAEGRGPRLAPRGKRKAAQRAAMRARHGGKRQAAPGGTAQAAPRAAAREEGRRHRDGHRPQLRARGAARQDPGDRALHRRSASRCDDRVKEMLSIATQPRASRCIEVMRPELDRMAGFDAVHQGVALKVPPYEYAHPHDLLDQVIDARPDAAVRRARRRHRPAQPRRDHPLRRARSAGRA